MTSKQVYYYRYIFSKLGNKLTSFVLIFSLIDSKTLSIGPIISIFLFSLIPSIIFGNKIKSYINKYNNLNVIIFNEAMCILYLLGIYFFINKNMIMLIFYFLICLSYFINQILDDYIFTKIITDEKEYETLSKIDTILSIIAPAIVGIFIKYFGYKIILIDCFSFFISIFVYYFIIKKNNIYLEKLEVSTIDKNYNIKDLKTNNRFFNILMLIYLMLVFIGNIEDVMIFPLLIEVKKFSEFETSLLFSFFSFGMFLGTFLNKYLFKIRNISVVLGLGFLDSFISIALAYSKNYFIIFLFYLIQGICAVNIILFVKKEFFIFYNNNNYVYMNASFLKLKNICSFLSYLLLYIIYKYIFINNIRMTFIVPSLIEFIILFMISIQYKISR